MSTDQIRPILLVALAFIGFLLWQAWEKDYGPKPRTQGEVSESSVIAGNNPVSSIATMPGPDVPDVPEPTIASTERAGPADAPSNTVGVRAPGIDVRTDVYRARILLSGGTLSSVELLNYPISTDEPDVPFRLLAESGARLFTAQSGLVGKTSAPNHHAQYTAAKQRYELQPGAEQLEVSLTWS